MVCFDERPCFLIGDQINPLPLQAGQPARQHYAYEKHGSCCLLAAIEPLQGHRIGQVYGQRTKKEYTHFMQQLAAHYPQAHKIHLVQDNLNTHTSSSFYEHLPAEEAYALAQRFQWHYTPKSSSWLNMIEIEFSALSKQCLDRRIASQQQLSSELEAIIEQRNQQRIKIDWQFSIQTARQTLNSRYQKVNHLNQIYQPT